MPLTGIHPWLLPPSCKRHSLGKGHPPLWHSGALPSTWACATPLLCLSAHASRPLEPQSSTRCSALLQASPSSPALIKENHPSRVKELPSLPPWRKDGWAVQLKAQDLWLSWGLMVICNEGEADTVEIWCSSSAWLSAPPWPKEPLGTGPSEGLAKAWGRSPSGPGKGHRH